jgi:hypothetical protein
MASGRTRIGRAVGLIAVALAFGGLISIAAHADYRAASPDRGQPPSAAPTHAGTPRPRPSGPDPQGSTPPPGPRPAPPGAHPTRTPTPRATPRRPAATAAMRRRPARHGAEVPLIVQLPPPGNRRSAAAQPGPGSGGTRADTRLATRSYPELDRGPLPSVLIYTGISTLTVALAGMLVVGVRRRRW